MNRYVQITKGLGTALGCLCGYSFTKTCINPMFPKNLPVWQRNTFLGTNMVLGSIIGYIIGPVFVPLYTVCAIHELPYYMQVRELNKDIVI